MLSAHCLYSNTVNLAIWTVRHWGCQWQRSSAKGVILLRLWQNFTVDGIVLWLAFGMLWSNLINDCQKLLNDWHFNACCAPAAAYCCSCKIARKEFWLTYCCYIFLTSHTDHKWTYKNKICVFLLHIPQMCMHRGKQHSNLFLRRSISHNTACVVDHSTTTLSCLAMWISATPHRMPENFKLTSPNLIWSNLPNEPLNLSQYQHSQTLGYFPLHICPKLIYKIFLWCK